MIELMTIYTGYTLISLFYSVIFKRFIDMQIDVQLKIEKNIV